MFTPSRPHEIDEMNYAEGIRSGFHYLMMKYPEVFAIGHGLRDPGYLGNTMTDLDKVFGEGRIIDAPLSELACTGAAIGAALGGYRPIIIHPHMNFMTLATDQIVNQAAKWSHMTGGRNSAKITIRGIIGRGGEQSVQQQALHAWYAHIPGLRVVMPATPTDARDLLISSVLSDDPVLFIDNRQLYDQSDADTEITEKALADVKPEVRRTGSDITLVGAGYAAWLCEQAATALSDSGLSAEVIDIRVLNPLDAAPIAASVEKTGHLLVVDDGWRTCGLAGEIIAAVAERVDPRAIKAQPVRITLPDAPAPASKSLEDTYYPDVTDITRKVRDMFGPESLPLRQAG
jgi:pyruvate dehydrogenase E1 component beta subunit